LIRPRKSTSGCRWSSTSRPAVGREGRWSRSERGPADTQRAIARQARPSASAVVINAEGELRLDAATEAAPSSQQPRPSSFATCSAAEMRPRTTRSPSSRCPSIS
jgi:hypothetical protein